MNTPHFVSPRAHVGANPLNRPLKEDFQDVPVGRSATTQTISDIHKATREVLTRVFPECLAAMGNEDSVSVTVDDETRLTEVCGVRYTLTFAGSTARFWVGLNIYRIIVILFLDRERLCDPTVADAAGEALIPQVLRHGIKGAKHVGYDVHVEEANVDGRDILSIWMTNWLPKDFLRSPTDQVFIGQDLALMMQSLCRAANRDNLKLRAAVEPRPL